MTRIEVINYLKSSGMSDEQINEIASAFCEDIKAEISKTVCEESKHCDGDVCLVNWCLGLKFSLEIIDKYIQKVRK